MEGSYQASGRVRNLGVPQSKGPDRTKRTVLNQIIVNYYRCIFTMPPMFAAPWALLPRQNVCETPKPWQRCLRKGGLWANHSAISTSLQVADLLLHCISCRAGSFGKLSPMLSQRSSFSTHCCQIAATKQVWPRSRIDVEESHASNFAVGNTIMRVYEACAVEPCIELRV